MNGQIGRSTILGDWIYDCVKNPDVYNIIDVGTGSGLGTTKVVYDAIVNSQKKKYLVYSLETYKTHYDISVQNVPKIPNFHLLHGYITRQMLDLSKIPDKNFIGYTRNDAEMWYIGTIRDMDQCENILHLIPEKIDLLILDGGPFSSYYEFQILKDRCKYFVLDDTNDIKNIFVLEEMISQPETYTILKQDNSDRNGWAIVEKNEK